MKAAFYSQESVLRGMRSWLMLEANYELDFCVCFFGIGGSLLVWFRNFVLFRDLVSNCNCFLLFLYRLHVTSLTYSFFYSELKIQNDWYRANKGEVSPTVPHILLILPLPCAKSNCTKNFYEAWMLFSSTTVFPWGLVRIALQFPFCKSELLWRREAHIMNFCERVAGSLPLRLYERNQWKVCSQDLLILLSEN